MIERKMGFRIKDILCGGGFYLGNSLSVRIDYNLKLQITRDKDDKWKKLIFEGNHAIC